jgi:hypothetical protein
MERAEMARYAWLLALCLLAVGCDGRGMGGKTAVMPTPSAEPTPSGAALAYEGTPPAIGLGHLYGQVLWNGRPAVDTAVRLCRDFSSFDGCHGARFTVRTNSEGFYLFENLEPGDYGLSVQAAEPDQWLYVTDGVYGAYNFVVAANETLVVAPQTLYKLDLRANAPQDGAELPGQDIILSWHFYPEATYYEVTLTPLVGEVVMMNRRVSETVVAVGLPAVRCDYRWLVAAFNEAGEKIAEMAAYQTFHVTDAPDSCQLALYQPADNGEVNGRDLTLNWEAHPRADSYQVLMWNESDPERKRVLNFETVTESSYRFQYPLVPAAYVWSVSAFDSNQKKIAASEPHVFTVTGD